MPDKQACAAYPIRMAWAFVALSAAKMKRLFSAVVVASLLVRPVFADSFKDLQALALFEQETAVSGSVFDGNGAAAPGALTVLGPTVAPVAGDESRRDKIGKKLLSPFQLADVATDMGAAGLSPVWGAAYFGGHGLRQGKITDVPLFSQIFSVIGAVIGGVVGVVLGICGSVVHLATAITDLCRGKIS